MNAKKLAVLAGILFSGRLDYFAYKLWARAKGLDFSSVPLGDLGLSNERSQHHVASVGAYLSSALKRIDIPPGSRVLDLGSGKGGAACTLAKFRFDEVLGVELSAALVEIAKANVQRLGLRNVRFECLDAGKFTDMDRFTHLYMFNPFPAPVVEEVLGNLRASLARKPRRFTLIYYYPFCAATVLASGLFKEPRTMTFSFSLPYHVYDHDFQSEKAVTG